MTPTTLYVIQEMAAWRIKLGLTGQPLDRRLSTMQVGDPDTHKVLFTLSYKSRARAEAAEALAHAAWAPATAGGEWFWPTHAAVRAGLLFLFMGSEASAIRRGEAKDLDKVRLLTGH